MFQTVLKGIHDQNINGNAQGTTCWEGIASKGSDWLKTLR